MIRWSLPIAQRKWIAKISALSFTLVLGVSAISAQDAALRSRDTSIKADVESLCLAVARKQVIAFRYHYDPTGVELRVVHPYAVGHTQRRHVLLFGQQVAGYSKSQQQSADEIPGWRNFRVEKIGAAEVQGGSFDPVKPPSDAHRAIREFVCKAETVFSG